MRNESYYFENPYENRNFSRESFRKYVDNHLYILQQAKAKGEPVGDIIDDTKPLLEEYTLAVKQINSGKATRTARTFTVDQCIEKFKKLITQREGLIRNKFGKSSEAYLEFFPKGLSQFSSVTKKNIDELFDQVIKGSNTYKPELGPELEQEFTDCYHTYKVALDSQEGKKGDVDISVKDIETITTKLARQLTINVHKLAILYIDNPGYAKTFFTNSLLRKKSKSKQTNGTSDTYTVTIPANATKEAGFAFSVDKTMLFSNVGSEAVLVYGAATVDAPLSPTAIELLSGEEKEITATQLGAPANRFILMMNKSVAAEAEVEILFV